MYCVDVLVLEHGVQTGVAPFDSEMVCHPVEGVLRSLADRNKLCIRMRLVDRNEFGAEAEAEEADAHFVRHDSPFVGMWVGACPD